MAPQCVCPHTTMSVTSSAPTAYSMVAVSPPTAALWGGMMLPALRRMKISPGSVCVSRLGLRR
jgi:hypothetical protein